MNCVLNHRLVIRLCFSCILSNQITIQQNECNLELNHFILHQINVFFAIVNNIPKAYGTNYKIVILCFEFTKKKTYLYIVNHLTLNRLRMETLRVENFPNRKINHFFDISLSDPFFFYYLFFTRFL